MQIKNFNNKDYYFPNSLYLAELYYRFLSLNDSEGREYLAIDKIKRFQSIVNERLKQGFNIIDISQLFQLTIYYCDSTEGNMPPFLPNLSCFMNDDAFEPRLKITKALINNNFLTPDSGMLFENKFMLGFENRIFDGIQIVWKRDINSLVTLIYVLYFLGKIETDDNFDKMIHRNRPKRRKSSSKIHREQDFPNVSTLIAGKYSKNKTTKGNFLINGIDSNKKWYTINRRCEGIRKQLMSFFEGMRGFHKDKTLDYLIKNKDNFNLLEPSGKDEKIDLQIIDLVCDCYKKPNISNSHSKPLLSLVKK